MAQLAEWLLPIPEVYGSNPVVSKLYIQHLLTVKCFEKTKMIPRMGQFEHNWFIVNLITTQCDKLECD